MSPSLSERVSSLDKTASRLQAIRDQCREDLESKRLEIEALSAKIEVTTKVGELFRVLMDKLVVGQTQIMEGVVTEGLRAIFHDQDLTLESEISQKYNKVAIDFFLKQGGTIRGDPLESFGGGPASISSLVIRIMTLFRLNRWPLLILDETLSSVSDDYVDQTGLFLQKLARSTKIDVLLVTHKQSFLDHADIAYQGYEESSNDGSWDLSLKRLRD